MEAATEPQASHDEALKKIGRNHLLFQQAEMLIKRILAIDSFAYFSGQRSEDLTKQTSIFDSMTMGQVAKLFLDRICPIDPAMDEPAVATSSIPAPPRGQSSIHIFIRLGRDPIERRRSFEELIQLRNEFVHQLLWKVDPASTDNWANLAVEMDELRLKILPEIQHLQQDLIHIREMLEQAIGHATKLLTDPKGMEMLLQAEIQRCMLIRNLATLAAENKNPDAWLSLGEAVKRVQDFPQEKIPELLNQFRQENLTGLLLASGLFVTRKESTGGDRPRTLYQLKGNTPQPSPSTFTRWK